MAGILSNGTGGGVWSSPATWAGGIVPAANNANVLIVAGDTVTVDGVYAIGDEVGGGGTAATEAIRVNGTLTFSRAVNTQLTLRGTGLVNWGGTWDQGTDASPIPAGVTSTILTNDSAVLATNKYDVRMIQSSSGAAPQIYIQGAPRKVNTTLLSALAAGVTTADVADATGWIVGDRVMLAGTDATTVNGHLRNELVTIATITPLTGTAATITWIGATTYTHAQNAAVAHFNSNVTLRPVNAGFAGRILIASWAGTATSARQSCVRLKYAHFENGGWGGLGAVECSTFPGALVTETSPWADSVGLSFYQGTGNNSTSLVVGGLRNIRKCDFNDFAFWAADGSCVTNVNNAGNWSLRNSFLGTGGSGRTALNALNLLPTDVLIEDCWFAQSRAAHIGWEWFQSTIRRCRFMSAPALVTATFTRISRPVLFNACRFATPDIGNPALPLFFDGSAWGNATSLNKMSFSDCLFNASTPFRTNIITAQLRTPDARFELINIDQDPLANETYTAAGNIFRNNTVFRGASGSSLEMQPFTVDTPITQTFTVFAPDGATVQVAGFLQRSAAGVTATATLSGLGITPVSQTFSGAANVGTWNEQFGLTTVQNTGADSLLTLTLSVTGTSGSCYWDSLSSPPAAAIDTGGMEYWFNGAPSNLIAATFVKPQDVWDVLTSELTLPGSVGQMLADVEDGYTQQEAMRLLLAIALGNITGGPGAPVFKSLDGAKDRVVGTATATGDRTRTSIDAS